MDWMQNATATMLPLIYHDEVWTPETVQRIVTLAVLMTLTLTGNATIIVLLTCSRYRKRHSRVNVFIINLAVGDLTVFAFTMTTEVLFVAFERTWILGNVGCKLLLYVQVVTLASTTFILMAMSYDRYRAICRPLAVGTLTAARPARLIAVSWLAAFLFAAPQLIIFRQVADGVYPDGVIKYACKSRGYTAWWQRKTYFTFMTAYILVVPTIVISFCYINVARVVWRQGKDGLGQSTAAATTRTAATTPNNGSSSTTCDVELRRTVGRGVGGVGGVVSCGVGGGRNGDGRSTTMSRAKMKTIKMSLAIILIFLVCWTPYFVVHLAHIWTEYRLNIPKFVYAFAETVAFLNSALNPIVYGCFNVRLSRGSGGGGVGGSTAADVVCRRCRWCCCRQRCRRRPTGSSESTPLNKMATYRGSLTTDYPSSYVGGSRGNLTKIDAGDRGDFARAAAGDRTDGGGCDGSERGDVADKPAGLAVPSQGRSCLRIQPAACLASSTAAATPAAVADPAPPDNFHIRVRFISNRDDRCKRFERVSDLVTELVTDYVMDNVGDNVTDQVTDDVDAADRSAADQLADRATGYILNRGAKQVC